MKTLWFWLRLLLDILGTLMLAGILLVLWLAFLRPWLNEAETAETTSKPTDYSWLMAQAGVDDFRDWQLISSDKSFSAQDFRCDDQSDAYMLAFRHSRHELAADLANDWRSTQQLSDIGALLLAELRQSPCARRLPAGLINGRGPAFKFRVGEASWWNGELERWKVYLYDSSTDTMTVWLSDLPP